MTTYDAVYFRGGSAEWLIERVNTKRLQNKTFSLFQPNEIYVGVSAESCISADNVKNTLGLIDFTIIVHCNNGKKSWARKKPYKKTDLTNRQS